MSENKRAFNREKLTIENNTETKKETNTIRRKKFQESVREKEHKVYRNWANWILMKGKKDLKIESFETDFVDGIKLIKFTEALTSLEFKYDSNPKHDFAKIANINTALDFFRGAKVQLSVQAEDFLKGNLANILGFFWMLIQRFQIVRGKDSSSKRVTKEEVYQWVENYISPYEGSKDYSPMDVFKLKDGNVLAWLVHQTDPAAIDLDALKDLSTQEKLDRALEAARDALGVPMLITSDVLMEDDPHEMSVLAYLYTFKATAEEYRSKRLQKEEEMNKKLRELEEQRRIEEEKRRKEEEERRRLEEEKRLEEERRRREEEEERQRLLEQQRREEEERRRLEELKRLEEERKRMEEERRRLEEQRRLEEEKRRLEEERRRLEEQQRLEEQRRLEEERQRQLEEDRRRRELERKRQEEIKKQREEEEERQRQLLAEKERQRLEDERRKLEKKRLEEQRKKEEEEKRRRMQEEQERIRKLREEQEQRKQEEIQRKLDLQRLNDAVNRARDRDSRFKRLLKQHELDNHDIMKDGACVDYNGVGSVGVVEAFGKYLAEACEICEKMLSGTLVIVTDEEQEEHLYHQHCFVCKKCSLKFTDYYWRYKDTIYCQPHYLEAADMKCYKCRDWIKDQIVVMAFDKKWHESCFCCEISGKKFTDNDPYYVFNGRFLCKEEYYKQTKYICHTSSKPIEDEVIVVDDRCYSNQFFLCSRCDKNLRHEAFYTVDGDPMCNKCVEEKNFHRILKNK